MIGPFKGEYAFLSNFYPAQVFLKDWKFPTVEHAYQAGKATNSEDIQKILHAETPGKAKKLGRTIALRDDWDFMKLWYMFQLVRRKFIKHSDLRDLLLKTGEEYLVEINNWGDTYWGRVKDLGGFLQGENMLGKILMNVRARLRREINES